MTLESNKLMLNEKVLPNKGANQVAGQRGIMMVTVLSSTGHGMIIIPLTNCVDRAEGRPDFGSSTYLIIETE